MVRRELDSPPTTPSFPSKRQFPNGNGPPDRDPNIQTSNSSSRTNLVTQTPSSSSSPTSMVITSTAVASQTSYNTYSLVIDPSADPGTNAKSAVTTASATDIADAQSTSGQSTAEKLFTPKGKLFAVGIVIIGLGVLTLLTCTIVITRCTLRRRRRERMQARQRAQSQSNVGIEKKRKMSADRASEFWSADAGRRTRSGDDVLSPAEDARLLRGLGRRPTRPDRTGEAETDLRAPGPAKVVHFTPSVAMSDYTDLSMDVQQSGSARVSGASMDMVARPGTAGAQLTSVDVEAYRSGAIGPSTPNTLGVSRPVVSEQRFSGATKWTLDPDPFASGPVMVPLPTPSTAKPLLSHAMTFPPYVPSAPHTPNHNAQFTSQLSSSPPDMAAVASSSNVAILGSPSQMPSLGSSLSSSNMLNPASPLDPPPLHRSSTGLESIMSGSDPFAYDHMRTPHMSLSVGGSISNPYTNSLGAPPPLYIAPNSPGIHTTPNTPLMYTPSPSSSAFTNRAVEMAVPPPALQPAYPSPPMQNVYLGATPPQQPAYLGMASPHQSYLFTPPQPSHLSLTPPQPSHPELQTDISQALSTLRRRMSDSTVASAQTNNTSISPEYRPVLSIVDESPPRPGYFMHEDGGSPASSRRSLPMVSKLRVTTTPEVLNQRTEVLQDGAPMYASPTSAYDAYYQNSQSILSAGASSNGRSKSGPGSGMGSSVEKNSPALPDSVRTSVLSYFEKSHV